ncbi:prominin-2 isoform X2 [Genypterus blacodes]
MKDLVQSFLNTFQPKPLPKDLILQVANDFEQVTADPDFIKQALQYEVGFLVCAAIGILYILLMPIVGFFLMCCRCCGNCGGEMNQKQKSSIHCHRRALYWSVFITTAIILAGSICMFKSNEALSVSVDQSTAEVNKSLDNLNTFLTFVPQQIEHVMNESFKTIDVVTENLNTIGATLGTEIQDRFRRTFDIALLSVRRLDQETVNTSNHLNELKTTLARLQTSMNLLETNVTSLQNRINQTISNPACNKCELLNPELQKLTLTVDFSLTSSSLSDLQSALDDVIKADLKSKIKEGEDNFNSIPQRVTNETKDAVQSIKQQLDEIQSQISQLTSDIPLSGLTYVSDTLLQIQREFSTITPTVEKAEHIRWGIFLALCCAVLLVVVCNILGLVLGPLGLRPNADPTERSCTANCGGLFLMMGTGFTFIFCWLLMVLVLLLFLICGNAYTLICRPWDNGNLLKFIDTPGLIPGFELGPALQLETNLTFNDVYSDCEKNEPLWSTLHLNEFIDLEDLLNVSKYTEEMQKYIENANISLPDLTLLSPEIQKQLSNFSAKAKDFNVTMVTQQIDHISKINFNSTADKLERLASSQTNPGVVTELRDEAIKLRQIQTNIETNIFPQMEKLNSSIVYLQSLGENISAAVGKALSTLETAQDFLSTNTTQIVGTESREFLDCQMSYFITYADWVNLTITQQVGRCGPVAEAVDTAEMVLCTQVVESLNAFWFSLGWCLIFFIPSVIFSVKLAKYYRRMEHSDMSDNHISMNIIPRANMKSY